MKYSVATNFQDDFIKKINKKEVYEIFGKLSSDFIGGGRSSYLLPNVSKRKIFNHIAEAHNNGLRFNYLLNAACLGNKEFTSKGQREIRKILDWLEGIEVDSITVALPYLLELVKKRYPKFKVKVSLFARIDNQGIARQWEELGADALILDSPNLNRNFEILKIIRKNVKCELELLANNNCLRSCPFGIYHSVVNSHASQSWSDFEGFVVDYCFLRCRYMRLQDPVNFIRSDWIRPEDVHYYEEAGIDYLKIVDRPKPTNLIVLAVDAYTNRRYDGNLAELISGYKSGSFINRRKKLFLLLKFIFRPFSFKFRLLKKLSEIPPGIDVYINNRALDGFLDFFIKGGCGQQGACSECRYCYTIAEKTVKIEEKYRQQMLEKYKAFFEEIY